MTWAHALRFFSDGAQHVSREITPKRIDGHGAQLVVTLCPRTVHGPHKARTVLHQNSYTKSNTRCPLTWKSITRVILLSKMSMCKMEYISYLWSL